LLGSPPAPLLRPAPEPAFPPAALEPGAAGAKAERAFNDDVLVWGRGLKLQIDRLCRWTENASGGKVQIGCTVPAPAKVR
jgi:hypothetical protein